MQFSKGKGLEASYLHDANGEKSSIVFKDEN